MRKNAIVTSAIVAMAVLSVGSALAADDLQSDVQALKARIAEQAARISDLERKDGANWLTEERASQIKQLVHEVITDARSRGQFLDGDIQVGYKDGFFIQTADQNTKLVVGGFIQMRYNYVKHHASHTGGPSGMNVGSFAQGTHADANGFDIRRARISFSGTLLSKDLFYKFEGDFYGGGFVDSVSTNTSSGNVTSVRTRSSSGFAVTDAFLGYRFNDQFKIRAGSFKVPFAKAELTSDTTISLMERPEVTAPFNAQRSIGVSLFGDLVKDQLNYEININNGSNSNNFRRVDTASSFAGTSNSTANYNLDNRLGYYGRLNWSPDGAIAEIFSAESDLRKDNSKFIWMLGIAGGYESQNSTNGTFVQNTASIPGMGSNDKPGYASNYTLNGDLFRGTIDWSAKYQGWSFNTAAYIQQINANPTAGTTSTSLPYGTGKSSWFQHGYYGQVGYMVTKNFELVGRAGVLLQEGDPNMGDVYSIGANYYLFGNNAKIQADVTYAPEAMFTDTGATLIQNTHELAFRVQLQLKF